MAGLPGYNLPSRGAVPCNVGAGWQKKFLVVSGTQSSITKEHKVWQS